MKTIYPAIFKKVIEDGETYYNVFFPSITGAVTYGETLEEAYLYAKDVLTLYVYSNPPYQYMHEMEFDEVKLEEGEFCLLVEAEDGSNMQYVTKRTKEKTKELKEFLVNKAKMKKLTLSDIEFIIGVRKGYFNNLFKDNAKPYSTTAKRIAKILDIDYKLLIK